MIKPWAPFLENREIGITEAATTAASKFIVVASQLADDDPQRCVLLNDWHTAIDVVITEMKVM